MSIWHQFLDRKFWLHSKFNACPLTKSHERSDTLNRNFRWKWSLTNPQLRWDFYKSQTDLKKHTLETIRRIPILLFVFCVLFLRIDFFVCVCVWQSKFKGLKMNKLLIFQNAAKTRQNEWKSLLLRWQNFFPLIFVYGNLIQWNMGGKFNCFSSFFVTAKKDLPWNNASSTPYVSICATNNTVAENSRSPPPYWSVVFVQCWIVTHIFLMPTKNTHNP